MTNSPERLARTAWTGWTPVGGLPLPGAPPAPDHRLEEALQLASDQLGLRGQFFSTPTSIMASFGPQDDQQTFLIRVEPGESNLGKLAQADEVTREVLNGRLTRLKGATRLELIKTAPPRYPTWLSTLAFAIVSGSAARFLGGGTHRIVLVPGSVGLQALASFVDSKTETGVDSAFRMVLIAVSLVAGTLIVNIVSPRRKLLT